MSSPGKDGENVSAGGDKGRTGVLLLHGLTGMPSEMRPLARHLERQGYRVKVPLLAGHGVGDREILACTWRDWVCGARQALDELCKECDRVIVGGLSMGSSIATVLAAEDPRVKGLVMLSTTLRYDGGRLPWTSVFLPLLPIVDLWPSFIGKIFYWTELPPYGLKDERLQRQITRAIEAAKSGQSCEYGLFRTYSASLRQMSLLVEQVRVRAREVTCPVLIIHSLEDTMTSTRNATEIYARFASSEKSIVFLTGCDHVLTLDLKKNEVARLVGEFVAEVARRPERVGGAWVAA